MPALDPETHERWRDLVVVDRDAATVGTITAFYLDRATCLPTWGLVHTLGHCWQPALRPSCRPAAGDLFRSPGLDRTRPA